MSRFRLILVLILTQICRLASPVHAQRNALVFQTDFGLKDGAVAAMKGVAFGVSGQIPLFDLTHEIPPYDIWHAAYRLQQTIAYWPAGTVFVSVVDPGVGSDRKSVVARTKSGHYIVTPDNGTLTLIAHTIGIDSLRQIDETLNRLPGSSELWRSNPGPRGAPANNHLFRRDDFRHFLFFCSKRRTRCLPEQSAKPGLRHQHGEFCRNT